MLCTYHILIYTYHIICICIYHIYTYHIYTCHMICIYHIYVWCLYNVYILMIYISYLYIYKTHIYIYLSHTLKNRLTSPCTTNWTETHKKIKAWSYRLAGFQAQKYSEMTKSYFSKGNRSWSRVICNGRLKDFRSLLML